MSTHEAHKMTDPRLPFIFHSFHFGQKKLPNSGNWHENIELLYFTLGSGAVTSNENKIQVKRGDVAVFNANCLHTVSSDGEMRYYCLIIDRSFCLSNHFDPNNIRFDSLVHDERLINLMENLIKEYERDEDFPYRVQAIRSTVLSIILLLCREYSHDDKTETTDSHILSCIKQAIGHIRTQSHRDISLDEIASLVGLSKYYFAREFKKITGYTFISYVNLIRCENAKRLLAEEQMSIGSVGRSCGFDNASYFTRTFSSIVGCTPIEYREKKKKS